MLAVRDFEGLTSGNVTEKQEKVKISVQFWQEIPILLPLNAIVTGFTKNSRSLLKDLVQKKVCSIHTFRSI